MFLWRNLSGHTIHTAAQSLGRKRKKAPPAPSAVVTPFPAREAPATVDRPADSAAGAPAADAAVTPPRAAEG